MDTNKVQDGFDNLRAAMKADYDNVMKHETRKFVIKTVAIFAATVAATVAVIKIADSLEND